MKECLLIFLGGGAGSLLRYGVSHLFPPFTGHSLPWHTLLVNFIGSALIGLIMGMLTRHPGHWLLFLLVTGFCGGFTTFSAFSFEVIQCLRTGHYALAALYIAGTTLSSLFACAAGFYLGK